jgi:hypothetical protein
VLIGDRDLSAAEMALVNPELLLRDLSWNPQRLSRNASRSEPAGPRPAVESSVS